MITYRLKDFLFFVAMFLYILQQYMLNTNYLMYYGYLPCTLIRLAAISFACIKIALTNYKYTIKSFCGIIVCFIIGILAQVTSDANSTNLLINILILVIAAKDIAFEKICDFVFKISGSALLFTVASSLLGIIENDYIREPTRIRYYLGFDYVSFGSMYFVNIVFCGFYSYKAKKEKSVPWRYILLCALFNYWIYYKTMTKLPFGIILIFLCLYVLVEKFGINILENSKIMNMISTVLFSIAAIVTYLTSYYYNYTDIRWIALNQFSSNRVMLNHRALNEYSIKAFGQLIRFNTNLNDNNYFYIDSGYMSVLLKYGFVFLVLVIFIYTLLLKKAVRSGNVILTMWLICICLFNVFNGSLLSPVTNSSLFAIWVLLKDLSARKRKKHYFRLK